MKTNKIEIKKVLLAGATGYLGRYVLKELIKKDYLITILARNMNKIESSIKQDPKVKLIETELTQADGIKNCCFGIDAVISTIGITRQEDNFSYMEVDYQINLNLLEEAKRAGVRKFVYVSVLNGEKLKSTAICKAKELFVEKLKHSNLEFCVLRPNAFFSDIATYFKLAKNGRILLFGKGEIQSNPIDRKDLAVECVNALSHKIEEIKIGGPKIKTQKEIAELAFKVLRKKPKITYLPDWTRKLALKAAKLILPRQKYGPVEFFLTAVSMEMVAPKYGQYNLDEYFEYLYQQPDLFNINS